MGQLATYSTSNSLREYAPFPGFFPLTINGTNANASANPTNISQFIELRSSIYGAEDTSGLGGTVVYYFDPSSSEYTTETHIHVKCTPYRVLFGNHGYPVVSLMGRIVAPTESPNYYQGVYILPDKPIVQTVSTSTPSSFPHLRVEHAREADYETAWAAYKRIEPHYSRTNRMLADM